MPRGLSPAFFLVLACAAGAPLLAWFYFRRYQIARPPVGVFGLGDVAVMLGGIALVPYLYLALPRWLVAGLLAAGMLGILYVAGEPVLRARWAVWLAALAVLGADVGAALVLGPASSAFVAINDAVLVLAVVGATNLWAQSGMKARDAAALAGALAVYDLVATSLLPLMGDLFRHLAGLPLAPLVAWPAGSGSEWLGIGLGDLLVAAVFPLVARKAFGRAGGVTALALALGATAALLALVDLRVVRGLFPVMVVLGPLIVLQYAYWRHRSQERTTWQYLQDEPRHHAAAAQ